MQLDTAESLQICGICDSRFMNDEDLRMHLLGHEKSGPCGSCIKMSLRLKRRKKMHICRRCDKKFALAEYLKIHIKSNYSCGKFFTRARNLKMKKKFRTTDGSYSCPSCTKCFMHFYKLKKHAKIKHGGVLHACSVYGKTVISMHDGRHMLSHSVKKKFSCVRCSMRQLRLRKIKPHSCPRCPKSFSLPAELEQHLAVHYSGRAYSCAQCDERFPYLGALKKHLVSHTGKKPHVCRTCGNRFSHSATLKIHLKIHAHQKAYSYRKCGKTIRTDELNQELAT